MGGIELCPKQERLRKIATSLRSVEPSLRSGELKLKTFQDKERAGSVSKLFKYRCARRVQPGLGR